MNGKTVSEGFPPLDNSARHSEVEAFHRFRQLSQQLLEVNEKICRVRPAEDHQKKKTSAATHQQVTREVERLWHALFTGCRKIGHHDWEAMEMTVRSAMHQAGAAALTELL